MNQFVSRIFVVASECPIEVTRTILQLQCLDDISESDALGYITPSTANSDILELRGSMWESLKEIASGAGLLHLWAGFLPAYLAEAITSNLQGPLEDIFNEYFDLYDRSIIPLTHQRDFMPNLVTLLASHSLIRILISPLEIIQTKMIAQSPTEPNYPSSVHCLIDLISPKSQSNNQIQKSPNSLYSLYQRIYPNLSLTILYHVVNPLFQFTTHLLIQRGLRISMSQNPLQYACTMGVWSICKLLILSPLKTIRRRLMIQDYPFNYQADIPPLNISPTSETNSLVHKRSTSLVHKTPHKKKYVVKVSGLPYTNGLNCLHRILTEENLYLKTENRSVTGGSILQLYRGFRYDLCVELLFCLLSVVSGLQIVDESDVFYF